MQADLKQKLGTWLPQIIIIIALNFIYFYPVLEGKILNQHDILMGEIKGKEITDYRNNTGEEPLWRNHLFSGMPELSLFPNSIFTYAQTALTWLGGSGTYIIAILMLGFFFWAKSSKVDPWIALIGAIAVGFSAFMVISVGAGHNAKIRTAAYMAPILMGILLTYRGKTLLGLAITAFFVGISVYSNHIQITYYTFMVILCLIATYGVYAYKNKTFSAFIKKSLLLAVAAFIGVGPNIGRLWTNYVNMKETMRGGGSELTIKENTNKDGLNYDYAMSWSYGISETANLVFPYATGGGSKGDYTSTDTYDNMLRGLKQQGYPTKKAEEIASQNAGTFMYWGEQTMVNGAYYMGAVVFFLFVFSLVVVKDKNKPWIVAALIISLILAWGKNIEPISFWLFDYLPFYDKFRVPSMALLMVLILVPYMAVLGLNQFYKQQESTEYYKKGLYKAMAISGGFAILWLLLGATVFTFEGVRDQEFGQYVDLNTLIDDRQSLFNTSIFTSLFYMILAFVALWLYNKKIIKSPMLIASLAVLILFDLWKFDKDQINANDFIPANSWQKMVSLTPADQVILKDKDMHYRVWNTTRSLTGDYATSYYHKSLGGIHASKLQRYQDLIDYQLSKGNQPSLDMLNTKWIIFQDQQSKQMVAQPNMSALGNAWFVESVLTAQSANQEMELITDFKPRKQVVVNKEFSTYVDGLNLSPEGSSIKLTKYDTKKMTYEADVKGSEQLAIFSEIYYAPKNQAWVAYIDNEKVDYIRVNYLLRGLKIPEGKHTVTFVFEPITYFVGEKVDLAFSIVLLLGIGFAAFKEYKTEKTTEENL